MTVLNKSRVPAEDLWYGTHRSTMNTNVLLQHLDPGQVSGRDPLSLHCSHVGAEQMIKLDGLCR